MVVPTAINLISFLFFVGLRSWPQNPFSQTTRFINTMSLSAKASHIKGVLYYLVLGLYRCIPIYELQKATVDLIGFRQTEAEFLVLVST